MTLAARPPRLVAVLTMAVALHLLVLAPLGLSRGGGPALASLPIMRVRVLPAARPAAPAAASIDRASVLSPEVARPSTRAPAAPPRAAPGTSRRQLAPKSPRSEQLAMSAVDETASAPPSVAPVTAAGPPSPAPDYLVAATLDPGPHPLTDIQPTYPTRAGKQQGVVVLRLLINEQGSVDNVAVVRATPPGYFEESALDAFGKALFVPGRLLGVPVKSQMTIEVEFTPINRGRVSGRGF